MKVSKITLTKEHTKEIVVQWACGAGIEGIKGINHVFNRNDFTIL